MKTKSNVVFYTIIVLLFIVFLFYISTPYKIEYFVAKNQANMESLIKEMETTPGEIFYVKDYQRNEIIYDKDFELIEFIKNIPLIDVPKGINNYDNATLFLGNPFVNENRIYLQIYNNQLIEITSYYEGE